MRIKYIPQLLCGILFKYLLDLLVFIIFIWYFVYFNSCSSFKFCIYFCSGWYIDENAMLKASYSIFVSGPIFPFRPNIFTKLSVLKDETYINSFPMINNN